MNSNMMITIDGVGLVEFKKSKRARNVNISVAPSVPVRVVVPLWVSYKRAHTVVCSKLHWIRKHVRRMKTVEKTHKAKLIDVSQISYAQKKKQLTQRAVALAGQHGFRYNKIFIRNQRTRWGSCSARNNISLNSKLMQLPDELIDYVILHELLHLRIKNHRRDFWEELSFLAKDAKALSARVKSYHLGLME